MTRIVTQITTALLLVVFTPALALAAANGNEVGKNVGDLLTGWATPLWAGVTALVSLVFLVNRKFTEMAMFLMVAVVVGGFVFQSDSIAGLIKGIWQTAANGGA